MHGHDSKQTRITIERVSVTTIRKAGMRRAYCHICGNEVGVEFDQLELKDGTVSANSAIDVAATVLPSKGNER